MHFWKKEIFLFLYIIILFFTKKQVYLLLKKNFMCKFIILNIKYQRVKKITWKTQNWLQNGSKFEK